MRLVLPVLLLVVAGSTSPGMSLVGKWSLTFQLTPGTRIDESELILNWGFAPGWGLESESKIYSDGLLRYQNFHVGGSFGNFSAWGKIHFHAQEVRYQKAWLNAEIPLGGGTFRSSFNHWASKADYSSTDRDRFGLWPCVERVSWQDAWRFMAREVYVVGPVFDSEIKTTGAAHERGVYLYVGGDRDAPDRFHMRIPEGSVADFQEEFGLDFWTMWVGRTLCVRGTIRGRRYTMAGGYSAAEMSLTSPSNLSFGSCLGFAVAAGCPTTTVRWFEAKNYAGQTVYVQGPLVSITGPATYHGYPNHYRVRMGGGGTVGNRVEVIMSTHPGWGTAAISYTNEVCVYGTISLIGGVVVILPPDLISTSGSPCCTEGGLPGMFLNWRFRYTLGSWAITADFGDCCSGFSFRQLAVEAKRLSLCCGLTYDAALSFTKARGLETASFVVRGVPLFCCGLTADLSVTYTTDQKSVSFEPTWGGITGCFRVYGDAVWTDNTWGGIAIYGFRVYCWLGDVRLEAGTAFDRVKMNSVSPLSFRSGEWEFLGLAYRGYGCCGGDLWFNVDFWFGDGTFPFGLRRVRLSLEVPVTPGLILFTRGMIDQSKAKPLEYWDIGWKFSF